MISECTMYFTPSHVDCVITIQQKSYHTSTHTAFISAVTPSFEEKVQGIRRDPNDKIYPEVYMAGDVR